MTARVALYLRRRFSRGPDGETRAEDNEKFSLPLLAFPLMWLLVFVILVTVASVQGSRDPVTRTVEVRDPGAKEMFRETTPGTIFCQRVTYISFLLQAYEFWLTVSRVGFCARYSQRDFCVGQHGTAVNTGSTVLQQVRSFFSGSCVFSLYNDPEFIGLVCGQVPLANLPACLDGYSLAMISDIHAGPTVGKSEVRNEHSC